MYSVLLKNVMNGKNMWFMVLLSVLLVNGAFFLPNYLGFLIVLFLIPVFLCVMSKKISFAKGVGWGLGVFGPHFVWMFCVLYYKSQAPWWLACLLYGLVVSIFSLSSGVWWWLMGIISHRLSGFYRIFAFIIPTVGYYAYFTRYALWFTGQIEGYPFLSPFIPLVHYTWFMPVLVQMGILLYGPPVHNKIELRNLATSPLICRVLPEKREEIYSLMRDLHDKLRVLRNTSEGQLCVVAPESACPVSLNKYPKFVSYLHGALHYDDHLFIGSQAEVNDKYYQTVYWITQGRIINFYVKKHRVPFTEKIPKFWRKNILLHNMFLRDTVAFSKRCPVSVQVFDTGSYRVIPQICSEFFFNPDLAALKAHVMGDGRLFYIFLFVNDSWFVGYFRTIIERLARVNGALVGLPVVYISHTQLTHMMH